MKRRLVLAGLLGVTALGLTLAVPARADNFSIGVQTSNMNLGINIGAAPPPLVGHPSVKVIRERRTPCPRAGTRTRKVVLEEWDPRLPARRDVARGRHRRVTAAEPGTGCCRSGLTVPTGAAHDCRRFLR